MNQDAATAPEADPFPWPVRTYPGKRVLDVVLCSVGLLIASPLLLLVAILVKLTSPGPVFYYGDRTGLRGRVFQQIKFRSMWSDAGGADFTSPADDRVTPLGRLLRFTKLDELPQLVNVLRGDMSLVGPRPEASAVVRSLYNREQLRVLSVRPGLTCLVQVRAYPDFSYHVPEGVDANWYYQNTILPQRLAEDLEYVDRMSPWLDLKILLQTGYCIFVKSWVVWWRQRQQQQQ